MDRSQGQLTHEMIWKMQWCLPPLKGYSRMCRSFAAGGQCVNSPRECVTGRTGKNTAKVAIVNLSMRSIFLDGWAAPHVIFGLPKRPRGRVLA